MASCKNTTRNKIIILKYKNSIFYDTTKRKTPDALTSGAFNPLNGKVVRL
jgi:hypothetical protein